MIYIFSTELSGIFGKTGPEIAPPVRCHTDRKSARGAQEFQGLLNIQIGYNHYFIRPPG